jgi:hypothetical protein
VAAAKKLNIDKCGCDDKNCPKRLDVEFGLGYVEVLSTDRKGTMTTHVLGIKKIEKLTGALNKFVKKVKAEWVNK